MNGRTLATVAIEISIVLVVVALVLGQALGTPILLSYVETGSMEPTIETGDGFGAIPAEATGEIEEGDVITFDAQELHGGGLTTHRVVDVTDEGYVTQGDANPFTDQSSDEPHVTDGQVVAVAWQVDGSVVTIPHLGTAVETIRGALESVQTALVGSIGIAALAGSQGLVFTLFGLGAIVYALALWRESGGPGSRTRSRSRSRKHVYDARQIVFGFALLLGVVTLATMVAMSGSTEMGIVSAEFDSDRPDVIPQGETETQPYELSNGGFLPIVSVMELTSGGIDIEPRQTTLGHDESVNATLSLTAPPETGYYLRSLSTYHYFALLPPPVIASLHAIHPWLAMGAVTSVVVSLFLLPVALVVGTGTIRTRERRRKARGGLFE
jgi:signal peptidase I